MDEYLEHSEHIDWDTPAIQREAARLATNRGSRESVVRACFEFVRDEIKHSADHQTDPITCRASDVLKYRTRFCYAKSHLLAALLRANKFPTALLYQRLRADDNSYCLHGLNEVYINGHGWHRIDARGNTEDIHSAFELGNAALAFENKFPGETLFEKRHSRPLDAIVDLLTQHQSWDVVAQNLPDFGDQNV